MIEVRAPEAVVMGASAGAVEALTAILPALPENFALPVIVVVHLPADKPSLLVDLFRTRCRMKVQEAEDKVTLEAGCVYFAPANYHILVERGGYLSLSNEEPVLFSRPSIDVLFETAADAIGPGLIGVILSGANQDGAAGAAAVSRAGGVVLVQSPEQAYAAEMPRSALKACPDAMVLKLEEIAKYLQRVAMP